MKWVFMSQLALILMASALACRAAGPYYVATTGNDGNNGSTWALAFKTISNGVANATTPGDVVNVSDGVYTVTASIVISNSITLRSVNGTNATFINGNYPATTNRCLYLSNISAMVTGFTITNGYATNGGTANASGGGGVFVNNGVISNCDIRQNFGPHGGGLHLNLTGAQALNCTIADNTAVSNGGGGVYMNFGVLASCRVEGNQSTNTIAVGGGGVYMGSNAVISNCVIAGNYLEGGGYKKGGGLYLDAGAAMVVVDSVISNNRCSSLATAGGTLGQAGGICVLNGNAIIRHSTITENRGYLAGAGVWVSDSATALLTNCVISRNVLSGRGYGAGISVGENIPHGSYSALWCQITGNLITNCDQGSGGGAQLRNQCVLDHCTITGNAITSEVAGCYAYGGGVYVIAGSGANPQIRNCLIAVNSAYGMQGTLGGNGGGLFFALNGTGCVTACTIAGNYAKVSGGGIGFHYSGTPGSFHDTISNCVVWSNNAPEVYALQDATRSNAFFWCCATGPINSAQGNITNNPVFVNAVSGDWHLQKGSSCINAGCNEDWMNGAVDMDGRSRIDAFSRRVDIGAYEYLPPGTLFIMR